MNPITIALVDDHALVRYGIRALLESEHDLHVLGEGVDGQQAIVLVQEKKPDILIIDIRMPKMTGIEVVEQLSSMNTGVKCIILSMHDSEAYILQSVAAGAQGYLLKDTGKEEFIKAIHVVHGGGKYYSGDISDVLVNNLMNPRVKLEEKTEEKSIAKDSEISKSTSDTSKTFGLTNKEVEVLRLILSGLTNKQISEKLQKSKRTVETHRFNLMRKMDVNNLMDLSKKAAEFGLG